MSIIDASTISDLLKINELNLEDEMSTVSSFQFTFSSLAIEAEEVYENSTMALEMYEASLAEKFAMEAGGKDELTQTEIKRMFRTDDKWNLLKKEQIKCHKNYKILERGAKAFETKAQMLMSLNKRDIFKLGQGMVNT